MVAVARAHQQAEPRPFEAPAETNPLARLAALHEEATETAQLANLLGRSIYAAGALCALSVVAVIAAGGTIAKDAVWAVLVIAAGVVMAQRYLRTIKEPFQHAALKAFAQDLSAVLLYAGFAWGAGAFLLLPADAGIPAILLFSAGMGGVLALLLRERDAAFLFLAPAALLTSFASVLRPLPGGALDAAAVLIGCAAVMGAMMAAEHWSARGRILPLWAQTI